jgi:hypothetical protein
MFRTLRKLVHFLFPPRIDWGRVVRVLAVKEDVFGYDAISLLIEIEGQNEPLVVQPETAGYLGIVSSLHAHLAGIDPDWQRTMMEDPVHCHERVLYDRA